MPLSHESINVLAISLPIWLKQKHIGLLILTDEVIKLLRISLHYRHILVKKKLPAEVNKILWEGSKTPGVCICQNYPRKREETRNLSLIKMLKMKRMVIDKGNYYIYIYIRNMSCLLMIPSTFVLETTFSNKIINFVFTFSNSDYTLFNELTKKYRIIFPSRFPSCHSCDN